MKRRSLAVLSLLLFSLATGAYYFYYISFTDGLKVTRNDLAYWLLIPSPLKGLPEIEGKAPVYHHSPGEGARPITITVLYRDLKNPTQALPVIRKYLADRGVRVTDGDQGPGPDAHGERYEAHVDVYPEAPGHEDIRIMIVHLD